MLFRFEVLTKNKAFRQAEIKKATNEMERILSVDGRRLINLDPGFINHGRLMLATTKAAGVTEQKNKPPTAG